MTELCGVIFNDIKNMITNEEYQKALSIVKAYRQQCVDVITEIDENTDKYYELRNSKLGDSDLSVRVMKVLFFNHFELNQFDSLVKDLANISRSELLRCRNLGKKSLIETEDLCKQANILMRP